MSRQPWSRKEQYNERQAVIALTNQASDEQLAYFYLQARAQGLLSHFFYQGDPGLRWFLDAHQKPENIWLLCLTAPCPYMDTQPLQIAGLGWINSITRLGGSSKGEVGELFLREYQGWFAKEATELLVEYAFDVAGLDALYGVTPLPNRAAAIFALRMGFERFGPLPMYAAWEGQPCDAWVEVLTRARWQKRMQLGKAA